MATVTALVPKTKPELLRIGNRSLSTHGFRHDAMEEHLRDHLAKPLSQQWCRIACLARTFDGRDTPGGREAMRKRLPRAFKTLLDHGLFLLIEYAPRGQGHNGEALAVKICDNRGDLLQQQYATEQLGRMFRRRLITEITMQKAREVLGLPTE